MKRTLLFVFLIAMLVLSACTAAPASDTAGGDMDADKTTVSLWLDDTAVNECFVEVVQGSFGSETAAVEFNLISDNYWDAIRTGVNGGAGPDVVFSPGPSFAFEMAQAGLLVPLSTYAEDLGWSDNVVDWALSLGTVDGELYSLPSEQETMVMYYTKPFLKRMAGNCPQPPLS